MVSQRVACRGVVQRMSSMGAGRVYLIIGEGMTLRHDGRISRVRGECWSGGRWLNDEGRLEGEFKSKCPAQLSSGSCCSALATPSSASTPPPHSPPLLIPRSVALYPFIFLRHFCLSVSFESSLLTSWHRYSGSGSAPALLCNPPFRGRYAIHYDGQPRRSIAAGQYCSEHTEMNTGGTQ